MRYRYNDTELKTLLSTMTILVDTREQKNKHITDYFDSKKIPYTSKKLDFGDYSAMIPTNKDLGIMRDLYLSDAVAVERKNSLDELAGNLGNERQRFENELLRSVGAKLYLLVENGSWQAIHQQAYKSEYSAKAFIASLKCFEARFNTSTDFVLSPYSGMFIHTTLYYHCREYLLKGVAA